MPRQDMGSQAAGPLVVTGAPGASDLERETGNGRRVARSGDQEQPCLELLALEDSRQAVLVSHVLVEVLGPARGVVEPHVARGAWHRGLGICRWLSPLPGGFGGGGFADPACPGLVYETRSAGVCVSGSGSGDTGGCSGCSGCAGAGAGAGARASPGYCDAKVSVQVLCPFTGVGLQRPPQRKFGGSAFALHLTRMIRKRPVCPKRLGAEGAGNRDCKSYSVVSERVYPDLSAVGGERTYRALELSQRQVVPYLRDGGGRHLDG